MAGALGFALGTGLSALGGFAQAKAQQKQQHEQIWDQFMFQNMTQHPEVAQTPAGQKELKRMFGPHAEAAGTMLDLAAKGKQQFAQEIAGALPTPSAAGGSMPPGQAGNKVDQIQGEIDRLDKIRLSGKYTDPTQMKFLEDHIKMLQDERNHTQRDQEFQQNQAGLQQQRAESNQLRAEGQQIMAGNAVMSRQIAELNATSAAEMRTFMQRMDSEKMAEDKQKNFDSAKTSLQKQFQAISAASIGTTTKPAMNASQLQPLIDSYNKQASTLAKRAKATGVDYDPDEFKPLKAEDIQSHPWYGLGTGLADKTTTSVSEADSGGADDSTIETLIKKHSGGK